MKISASIYSSTSKDLPHLIKELDEHNIDLFHIDCIDDLSVFNDIKTIKGISNTPVDLHIITENPNVYFPYIEETGAEYVCFQYENLNGTPLQVPEGLKCRLGLAITSDTPVEVFENYKDKFDFILLMTTTPGKSGGIFNKENFKKIRKFAKAFPGKRIHVDGGVNEEVSFILRNMGVYAAVTGSYLLNADYVGAALLNLKSDNITSHFHISDFMIEVNELPMLVSDSFSFEDILRSIDDYKLGFTNVVDKDQKLIGLISNADVRKGLIRNINNLNNIPVNDLINRNPIIINENRTINELLKLIKSLRFPILFVPVVDDQHRLTGAVTFNNLIKGEL